MLQDFIGLSKRNKDVLLRAVVVITVSMLLGGVMSGCDCGCGVSDEIPPAAKKWREVDHYYFPNSNVNSAFAYLTSIEAITHDGDQFGMPEKPTLMVGCVEGRPPFAILRWQRDFDIDPNQHAVLFQIGGEATFYSDGWVAKNNQFALSNAIPFLKPLLEGIELSIGFRPSNDNRVYTAEFSLSRFSNRLGRLHSYCQFDF